MAGILKNRYHLISDPKRKIAQGDMSEVSLARDTGQSGRPFCCVKRLKLDNLTPVQIFHRRTLFNNEIEFLKILDGCNGYAPKYIDSFDIRGEQYVIQQWIEGLTLKQHIEKVDSQDEYLSEQLVRNIIIDLLYALKEIHSHGIIHQDIKPANIVLRANSLAPVLIDFGVARYKNEDVSNIPPVATKMFAPPEQVNGHPEYNSDLYALGITVAYALTKVRPVEMVKPLIGQTGWRRYAPNVSAAFADIIDRAIQEESSQRYPSADAMLSAVQLNNAQADALANKISSVLQTNHISEKPISESKVVKPDPTKQSGRAAKQLQLKYLKFSNLRRYIPTINNEYIIIPLLLVFMIGLGWLGLRQPVSLEGARNSFDNEDYDTAIVESSNVLEKEPNNAEAHFLRAKALYQKHDYRAAVKDYEIYNSLRSDDPQGYIECGSSYQQLCECEAASSKFSHAIAIRPTIEGYDGLAGLLFSMNKLDDALKMYKKMFDLDPTTPRGYVGQANVYLQKGKTQEAIKNYTSAIKTGKAPPETISELAGIYYDLDDYDNSIKNYEAYSKLRSDDSSGYHNIALSYFYKKEYSKALDSLKHAIALAPDDPANYSLSGEVKYNNSDFDGAINDFNQFFTLVEAHRKATENQTTTSSIHPSPESTPPVAKKCDCGFVLDNDKDENDAMSNSDLMKTREADAHYYRGLSYIKKGNNDAAVSDLRQVGDSAKDTNKRKDAIQKLKSLKNGS
jgi:serine/threonine protein kinase/DNA-binding SARP family transcriptional activator